mmetsp:Transcript_3402/g.9765  ORF Transcript_3402/g.9765 Transcript_3402/m.9765 type:complete len:114 (+) Transcript_3402:1954-2295(+)
MDKSKAAVSGNTAPRPSSAEVLRYDFFKQADKKGDITMGGAQAEGWVQAVLRSFSSQDEDLDKVQESAGQMADAASKETQSYGWVQSVLNSFSSQDEDLDEPSARKVKSKAME